MSIATELHLAARDLEAARKSLEVIRDRIRDREATHECGVGGHSCGVVADEIDVAILLAKAQLRNVRDELAEASAEGRA